MLTRTVSQLQVLVRTDGPSTAQKRALWSDLAELEVQELEEGKGGNEIAGGAARESCVRWAYPLITVIEFYIDEDEDKDDYNLTLAEEQEQDDDPALTEEQESQNQKEHAEHGEQNNMNDKDDDNHVLPEQQAHGLHSFSDQEASCGARRGRSRARGGARAAKGRSRARLRC